MHERQSLEVIENPDALQAWTSGMGPGNLEFQQAQWGSDVHMDSCNIHTILSWTQKLLALPPRDDPVSPGTCVCPQQTEEETHEGGGEGPTSPYGCG